MDEYSVDEGAVISHHLLLGSDYSPYNWRRNLYTTKDKCTLEKDRKGQVDNTKPLLLYAVHMKDQCIQNPKKLQLTSLLR